MENSKIDAAIEYATSLIDLPFRWYDPELDSFVGTDKFWCENSAAPSSDEIKENDKSIVCAGFPNLLRRKCGHSIPGLNGNIKGKFKELFKELPGGTGAWFRYLNQRKRLEKLDMKMKYPKGTLLLAKFKDNDNDQGHCAVVYDDVLGENVNEQLIIHSSPDMLYTDRTKEKNHGSVKVEIFSISNEKWRATKKKDYYTYICRPENWLGID